MCVSKSLSRHHITYFFMMIFHLENYPLHLKNNFHIETRKCTVDDFFLGDERRNFFVKKNLTPTGMKETVTFLSSLLVLPTEW